eukprot:365356-Chlamydomonas_euryale.AAC.5
MGCMVQGLGTAGAGAGAGTGAGAGAGAGAGPDAGMPSTPVMAWREVLSTTRALNDSLPRAARCAMRGAVHFMHHHCMRCDGTAHRGSAWSVNAHLLE